MSIKNKNDEKVEDVEEHVTVDQFRACTGYSPRDNQLQLVNHLCHVTKEDANATRHESNVCVLQAAVGAGKTFIALIYGLVMQTLGFVFGGPVCRTLVIAPHTNGLQLQWEEKAKSMLNRLNLDRSVVVLYGKDKYICEKRLLRQDVRFQKRVHALRCRLQSETRAMSKLFTRMYATNPENNDGVYSALTHEEFDMISCGSCDGEVVVCERCKESGYDSNEDHDGCDECKRKRCTHCQHTGMLEKAKSADILIVNQDLLKVAYRFGHDWLNLGRGGKSDPIVIVDEAHEMPAKFLSDGTTKLDIASISCVAERVIRRLRVHGRRTEEELHELNMQLDAMKGEINALCIGKNYFEVTKKGYNTTILPCKWGEGVKFRARKVRVRLMGLMDLLYRDGGNGPAKKKAKTDDIGDGDNGDDGSDGSGALEQGSSKAEKDDMNMRKAERLFNELCNVHLTQRGVMNPETVRILMVRLEHGALKLVATPIDTGKLARAYLINTPLGVSLTLMSATLLDSPSPSGQQPRTHDMSGFLGSMGLMSPWYEHTPVVCRAHKTFVAPLTFNYKELVDFRVRMASWRRADDADSKMCQCLKEEIATCNENKAVLVLCKKIETQRSLYAFVKASMCGKGDRACYLADKDVEATERFLKAHSTGVVVATKTYYTGIDYKHWGMVFMDSVPHEVPDEATEAFYIFKMLKNKAKTRKNRNARVTLIQGFGRLIRIETGGGKFVLCTGKDADEWSKSTRYIFDNFKCMLEDHFQLKALTPIY
jgi:Rad3-related DNA helicase